MAKNTQSRENSVDENMDDKGWFPQHFTSLEKPKSEQREIKTLLKTIAVVILLSGVAMIVVGVWTLYYEEEYHLFLESARYLIIVGLMIGIGGVVVLVCVCGCYGTYKEHRYMLLTFLIMLSIIFIIQLSVGIVAFVHRSEVRHEIDKSTRKAMNDYGNDDDVTLAFDKLHRTFNCCGDATYSTWNASAWRRSEVSGNNSVPDSCCKTPSRGCGKRDHPSNINREGCLGKLTGLFQTHLEVLGGVLIGTAALQLIGILMTVCALRFVEDYY